MRTKDVRAVLSDGEWHSPRDMGDETRKQAATTYIVLSRLYRDGEAEKRTDEYNRVEYRLITTGAGA